MNNNKTFFYLLAAGLLGLLIATYSNHFNNPFQFDDDHTIVSNQYIRNIHNIPLFFKDARTTSSLPANQAYRPGLTTLNAIDYWMGGKDEPIPFYFHISIFLSYILLGILLYFFLLKIFNLSVQHKWNNYFALFAAAFFMLHTANAETINYIIARGDSFSTMMVLLAFVIYQYKPAWRKFYIYLLAVLIGYFVKEPAVMFAPLLFFYILFFEKDISLGRIFSSEGISKALRTLLYVLPGIILAGILFFLSQKMTPPGWTATLSNTLHDKILYMQTQTFVVVHYFNNFILPVNLSADTDWTLITNHFDDRIFIGLGFISVLVWLAFYTSKKQSTRPIAFGILWFFLALLPTSSIIPFSEVLNDHRTFFPYVGLAFAGAWAVALLIIKLEKEISINKTKITFIVTLSSIILFAHAAGTHNRNKVWSSGESLWQDVTIKSPNNGRGLMNYGNVLMNQGKFKEALDYYERGQKIWPSYSYLYINIGILKNLMGLPVEAETNLKYALQLNSANPECYYYYASFLMQQNRMDEARTVLAQGLNLSPAHQNMLTLKAQLDKVPVVNNNISKLDQAIINASNHPSPENYLELSLQYYLAQKYDLCITAANEALKLKPNYAEAYNNICTSYNMLKDYDKAIAAGEKALSIDPNDQLAKNNLMEAIKQKGLKK